MNFVTSPIVLQIQPTTQILILHWNEASHFSSSWLWSSLLSRKNCYATQERASDITVHLAWIGWIFIVKVTMVWQLSVIGTFFLKIHKIRLVPYDHWWLCMFTYGIIISLQWRLIVLPPDGTSSEVSIVVNVKRSTLLLIRQ